MGPLKRQRKIWVLLELILIVGVVVVCAISSGHYNYSVSVVNEGHEEVMVDDFALFSEGRFNKVGVGLMLAKGEKSMSPYLYAPKETVTIRWESTGTGKRGEAEVHLKLPNAFTKKYGTGIYFYIDPGKGAVRVAYEVRNDNWDRRFVE